MGFIHVTLLSWCKMFCHEPCEDACSWVLTGGEEMLVIEYIKHHLCSIVSRCIVFSTHHEAKRLYFVYLYIQHEIFPASRLHAILPNNVLQSSRKVLEKLHIKSSTIWTLEMHGQNRYYILTAAIMYPYNCRQGIRILKGKSKHITSKINNKRLT